MGRWAWGWAQDEALGMGIGPGRGDQAVFWVGKLLPRGEITGAQSPLRADVSPCPTTTATETSMGLPEAPWFLSRPQR